MLKKLPKDIVNKICSIAFVAILGMSSLMSQEAIPVTGGEAFGSGGSVSFSIGQTFFSSHLHDSGIVTEGVQQPYELFIITNIDEIDGIELLMSAYPNPVNDLLNLKVEKAHQEEMSWQLYNMAGTLIDSGRITSTITDISMLDKKTSVYFLKVIQNNREIKTFKIIKNQ